MLSRCRNPNDPWIVVDDSKDYKTGWLRRCHLAAWGHA
jgi:hypothetical protein